MAGLKRWTLDANGLIISDTEGIFVDVAEVIELLKEIRPYIRSMDRRSTPVGEVFKYNRTMLAFNATIGEPE